MNVPTNPAGWKWQWELTALGSVKNPTGPAAADVVRRATAVVPVVIPDSTSVPPGTTATDWIYGFNDVTFGQSVVVAAPVYAGHDLILSNTSTISETIPASLTLPARPNRIAAGHNLTLENPQNQVGHVNGSADPANDLAEIHVANLCSSKNNPTPHACVWGATDKIWGVIHDNVIPPGYITTPTLTCCTVPGSVPPIGWAAPADGASHPATPPTPSYMGFWYLNAGLGPKTPCATSSGTPPRFDTVSGTPDNTINQSAYLAGSPFDLTGATYSCTSADGQTKLAWDGTTLTIKGTVFIDGSARSTSGNAKYVGKGTIILSGLYSMDNNTALCVNLTGGSLQHERALGRRHHRPRDRRRRDRPLDRRQHRHQEGELPGAAPRQREHRRERLGDSRRRPDGQRLRERQRRTERHPPVPSDHLRRVGLGRTDRPASTPSTPRTHPIRRRIAT